MKSLFVLPLALIAAAATAQEAPALKAGADMPLAPLTAAKWIQGEAPAAFEPGKVYIFECWATWCGPCVKAIPHINALHQKYAARGLRVYGMNVFEDGEAKVTGFVKTKGEGMSYPVAYTGKNSAFELAWLKPAGIANIPRAFVVRDGKLVMICHPDYLTEARVEQLLSGGEGARKAAESVSGQLNARKAAAEKSARIQGEFREASARKDFAAMAAKIAELEEIFPASVPVTSMKLELAMHRKDWPAATQLIAGYRPGLDWNMALNTMAVPLADSLGAECPPELIQVLATAYARGVEAMPHPLPSEHLNLASLRWKTADKAGAVASARKAVEVAGKIHGYPVAPAEKFLEALEAGKLPTRADLTGWLREAAAAKKAAEAAPAKAPAAY